MKTSKTLIGRGGYGWVYKGKLLVSGKETIVAVKRLNEQYGQEFLTDPNLVSLVGYCDEGLSGEVDMAGCTKENSFCYLVNVIQTGLISLVRYCDEGKEKTIVYEYAERGSLDQYTRRRGKSTSTTLTWLQRLKICADAARGLDHLLRHVGGHRMIIRFWYVSLFQIVVEHKVRILLYRSRDQKI
ncbi:serine-threonine/tyrosine-protein kinase catalytic domain-containing protein [Tanacetum coccineum]